MNLYILKNCSKYRIKTVMKVETDIIASKFTASLVGWVVTLVIIYVETFIIDIIVFIGKGINCLTYHTDRSFSVSWSQFVDTENIPWLSRRKNVLITDNYIYHTCMWILVGFTMKKKFIWDFVLMPN